MNAKIKIEGILEIVTGLHIGTGGEYAAIGMADAPVVRDIFSDLPMIPGSSLKGKMRSLLAQLHNETPVEPKNDCDEIARLFGSMGKQSRLVFSDMILMNMDELRKEGVYTPTEVKYENSISRITGVASPRQIERTIRGSKFNLDIVYHVENENEVLADMALLTEGIKALRYDYLGGSGSRGYGKVAFKNLKASLAIGEMDESLLEKISAMLKEVQSNEV